MLKDLQELLSETSKIIKGELGNISEYEFSPDFKSEYKKLISNEIVFHKSTAIIPTSTKTVVAPSLWFVVACHLTDLLEELEKYKIRIEDIIRGSKVINFDTQFESWADALRKGEKEIEVDFINYSTSQFGEADTEKVKTFVTDYSYWGGGKSIGRSQNDFAHSVLLKASGLLNESSGYLSTITFILLHNPILKKIILAEIGARVPLSPINQIEFNLNIFDDNLRESGLLFTKKMVSRLVSSLATKPFVLLSGLSGSGKTKLAQSFAQWICEDKNQYCIVPVGADWTNREPLLGYVNSLDNTEYILPENGALKLMIEANKKENQTKPYFLILDEMNLSHVERYFADFLSVMESKDKFKLHSSGNNLNIIDGSKHLKSVEVPPELDWPKNLFIIGTVNIDETTYMFSPKVLDRANAIEFRVSETEIKAFLDSPNEIDLTRLDSKGANMGVNFIEIAENKQFDAVDTKELNKTLVNFFAELKKTGAEFGYRTSMEIHRLFQQLSVINNEVSENDKIDIAVMQKLLPKLHGSRRKLCPILETLAKLCVKKGDAKKDFLDSKEVLAFKENTNVIYPLSLEKITRMYKGAIDNGFASYAEA